MDTRLAIMKKLFVVALLLAVSSDGFARSGLLSSTRQAIKQHSARAIATAGALLMLCAGGCEKMEGVHFVAADNPADGSGGSIELFRSVGESGSYVGNYADYEIRLLESDVTRLDREDGVTVSYHEREDVGDLVIDITDNASGVLSERYYLALVEENGNYTIYDRIGPGRVAIGRGTNENDAESNRHLRLSFRTQSLVAGNAQVAGPLDIIAYVYNPVEDRANDRVGRSLRLEYPRRPWIFAGVFAEINIRSQTYWNGTQTVLAQGRPTDVGLRSVGDMYNESYLSGGQHKSNVNKIFSASDGFIRLFNQSGQQFETVEGLQITVDEHYGSKGSIDLLSIHLSHQQEFMSLAVVPGLDKKSNKGQFVVYDSLGNDAIGKGLLSDDALRMSFNDNGRQVNVELASPVLDNNLVFRHAEIYVDPGEPTSVFGQNSAAQTVFTASVRWDAESSARLSE